jgi:hypothetical protein
MQVRNSGMVPHTCNSSTRETEGGRSQLQGQPRLYSKTLYQKKKKYRLEDSGATTLNYWKKEKLSTVNLEPFTWPGKMFFKN